MPRSRSRGRTVAQRLRGLAVLLVALGVAALCAVLPDGPRPPAPDRVMVATIPSAAAGAGPRLAALEADARAQQAVRLVLVTPGTPHGAVPRPPLAPSRAPAPWEVPAALLARVAQAASPPAVLVAGSRSVQDAAGTQPPDVEVVGAHGVLLRASAASRAPASTPLLRLLGLIAVGLLAVPSLRAAAALLPERSGPASSSTAAAPAQPPARDQERSAGRPAPGFDPYGAAHQDTAPWAPPPPRPRRGDPTGARPTTRRTRTPAATADRSTPPRHRCRPRRRLRCDGRPGPLPSTSTRSPRP
ncbi:hypothetical protein [Actinacidiphila yeochonensis]|uniref:hypothetical protein n=1 Tax=Actinacidiphila yeochonensis TaxID=89050 RepID=UPI0012FEF4FE|nr:hypothetical protein [Actinacidiphila yeochonensis]